MAEAKDGLPILPHVAGEFYVWLWWASEQQSGRFDLGDPVGAVDAWIDDRLAFRLPSETRVSAIMTGDDAPDAMESRAALAGGKVVNELRLAIKRDDREFSVTLKGPAMHLGQAKLPAMVTEGGEEVVFERMHLYEELCLIVAGLFRHYAAVRASPAWEADVVPALRRWVVGEG
jgi:hypothetical protein